MIKWMAVFFLILCAPAQAWECKYDKRVDQDLDVSGSSLLKVAAVAGDLRITGESGRNEVEIRGKICVSEEEWLDDVTIETTTGDTASIAVVVPDSDGWSLWGNRYAYVDLELLVPADLNLDVKDSSGDMEIESVAAVRVQDSSGDIEITDATGPIEVKDSSGDIRVEDIAGDFTVLSDSSGQIRGNDIEGNVLVENDSSGDIRFTHIGKNVTVENDSSGDIEVSSVSGDFTVLHDGSGEIDSKGVEGETNIPKNKRS